jgi:F0F1-type ATP synthase epsilon subunit
MAKLKLEIVTPSARAFSGDVDSVVIPAADGEIDEKAAEAAVQRAREAMNDPSNTVEAQVELEASLKRSIAEIEFRRRRRGSRSKLPEKSA